MTARTPVSIVVPAFNQLEYCRQCVGSLIANTRYPHKLILVDNGSTDGVGAFFDAVPDAVVVHTGENLGYPGGINRGLAHAEGHVCLLNSDTIVPPGWLERLVATMENAPSIGAVGPMSNCVSGVQRISDLDLDSMDAIAAFADQRFANYATQAIDVERLVGFCMIVRDTAFQKTGVMDESFGIGNFEDDDYCMRIRQAGYRTCVALGGFVFHYGGRTFSGMGFDADRYTTLMNENAAKFMAKWNVAGDESRALQIARNANTDARAAIDRGDLTEATRKLSQGIAVCPAYAPNYNDLGVVLWESGDKQRALEYFKRAIQIDPAYEEAKANARDAADALQP